MVVNFIWSSHKLLAISHKPFYITSGNGPFCAYTVYCICSKEKCFSLTWSRQPLPFCLVYNKYHSASRSLPFSKEKRLGIFLWLLWIIFLINIINLLPILVAIGTVSSIWKKSWWQNICSRVDNQNNFHNTSKTSNI